MALDRLTKIDGGGISTTSDYRVGVITATKFVGPVEGAVTGTASTATLAVNAQGLTGTPDIVVGIITASSANFSGNVTVGGTLTYEDVTNIDSVGLITARNGIHVKTGTATTALVVEGNGRVTGILTVGTSSLILDGPNNLVNVGTALTLGHSQGVQFHTQNLHSQGFEVNQINASGIITASSFRGLSGGTATFQDIDVDGHTNLDNVSIVGVTTTNGDVHIGSGDLRFDNSGHKIYTASSAHTLTIQGGASNPGGKIEFRGGTSDNDIRFFTSDGSGNSVEKLRIASNGNISITNDLDVDGHTNLDNVSVAGVSTFTGTVNLSTINSTASNLAIHNTADRVLIKGSNRIDIADNTVRFQNRAQNETLLHAVAGASGYVKLYHSNNLVASVTQDALTVTGRTSNSGMVEIASNQGANNNDRFRIHKTSAASRLTIQNYSTGSWVENIRFNSDGEVSIATGSNTTNRLTFGGSLNIYHDGNMKFENVTGYLKLQCNNQINIDGSPIYFRNSGGTNRWIIDSSGHFLPGAVGSYNIGSATAEIGDVYIADDKKVQIGSSQDLQIYHTTSGTSWIRHTNSSEYFILEGNQMDFRDYATGVYRARMGTAVQLYYNGNNVKLSTTNTGITVTGEVAASQDYPDFEPVLNFNFAGSSTQLDPRLLYRRSGVASFYDANGLVKLVGENTPRFDHDPISRKNKGILIEHSRTNLFLFGTTPGDNWTGAKNGTFTENTTETTAPDGTFTATKWTFTTTDPYLYQTTTLSANTSYTMSMWVKAGTNMAGDRVQMRLGGAPYSSGDAEVIPADGTWRRITYTKTVGGSNETSVSVGFEPQTSPSGNPASGDVIYIWGAQLEVGAYVSSFIPTYGRSQTRGADLLLIDGDDSTALSDAYNDQEGTLVVEYHNVITDGSYVATIDDGSGDNRFGISNSNSSQGISVSGGSSQGQLDNGTPIVGATNKMAHAYKLNDRGLSINGNDATQDNGFALPTGIRFIWIGCRQGSYDFLGSTISRFMYYTKRLPNSQLKLLTSQ